MSWPPTNETIGIVSQDPAHNGLRNIQPSGLVSTAINILLGGAGIAAFIYLLWGGFQWITSGGDKEALDKAKKRITHALIGLAVVFSAYALIFIVRAFFNINAIQLPLRRIGTAPSGGGGIPAGNCACTTGGSVPSGSTGPIAGGVCATCNSGAWGAPYYLCPPVTCP